MRGQGAGSVQEVQEAKETFAAADKDASKGLLISMLVLGVAFTAAAGISGLSSRLGLPAGIGICQPGA